MDGTKQAFLSYHREPQEDCGRSAVVVNAIFGTFQRGSHVNAESAFAWLLRDKLRNAECGMGRGVLTRGYCLVTLPGFLGFVMDVLSRWGRTGCGRSDYFAGGTLVVGGGVESDFGRMSAAFAWMTFLSRVTMVRSSPLDKATRPRITCPSLSRIKSG